MGRGAVDLLCCGDVVMSGGRGGWLGFEVGEETAGGDVAGEGVADMTVVIFGGNSRVVPEHNAQSTRTYFVVGDVAEATAPNHSNVNCCPQPLSVRSSVHVWCQLLGGKR